MALNLWKIGGKPTSYNPLPTGLTNGVQIDFSDYVISFRAKSASNSVLRVGTEHVAINDITLTSNSLSYSVNVKKVSGDINIYLYDLNSKGDIIIDSITLVRKPLPKLTINGVDGFKSGKWNLASNTVNNGDGSITLNSDSSNTYMNNYTSIPVLGNQVINYSYNVLSSTLTGTLHTTVTFRDSSKTQIGSSLYFTGTSNSFTTPVNAAFIDVGIYTQNQTGKITVSNLVVNLGSIPAPYIPKSGDRMVLPTAKKNLFNGNAQKASGFGTPTFINNVLTITGQWYTAYAINVNLNTNYYLSGSASGTRNSVVNVWGDSGGSSVIKNNALNSYFNSGQYSTIYIAFYSGDATSGTSTFTNVQLEQSTVATPYTPYSAQLNKRPQRNNANGQPTVLPRKTGLSFNGLTDYLQLPSMTMDAIEIDCLIDSNQPNAYGHLIDARNGLANGYVLANTGTPGALTLGNGFSRTDSNTFSNGQRVKLKFSSLAAFTDDVVIFGKFDNTGYKLKGILYKVTCYLAGNIVAQYDFENSKNIVGNQVIPSAQNLIPSFEDTRWSIHANAKVLGKDVLHTDSTGSAQNSNITLKVPVGVTFKGGVTINSPSNQVKLLVQHNGTYYDMLTQTFTTVNDTITVYCANNTFIGSYDFIRPQLYQLSGKEGTIYGNPVLLNKPAKRKLYAKR